MKKPIRVLNLSENAEFGGINAVAVQLARGFQQHGGVEMVFGVLSERPGGWLFDRMRMEQIPLEWLAVGKPPDWQILGRLKKMITKKGIDIVHTNGYRGDFYIRTMLDLRFVHLPAVVTKHGLPPAIPWLNKFYSWLDRRPTFLADRTIAVDSFTMEWMMKRWNIAREKMRLIHNPAAFGLVPGKEEIRSVRNQLGLADGAFIALYLGRLEREKGLFELIAAHRQLCQEGLKFLLLIVGDGQARAELMDVASRDPAVDYIKFIAPQLITTAYLALADVLVLPSYHEGLPMALLEAMAAAKPIIATSVGGIPDLLRNLEEGILIPPHDIQALSEALRLVHDHRSLALKMGKNACRRAAADFAVAKIADAMTDLYRELV